MFRYLFNVENLMEMTLIALTFALLLGSHSDVVFR